MGLREGLTTAAQAVSDKLFTTQNKLVLAESCTSGMVAAALGAVPGISSVFCGSAVTYQQQTKTDWLSIQPAMIVEHSAESAAVTLSMAEQVLVLTSEAQIAAAVTGHLGPGAPGPSDGRIDIAIVSKNKDQPQWLEHFELTASDRSARQLEASTILLQQLIVYLQA